MLRSLKLENYFSEIESSSHWGTTEKFSIFFQWLYNKKNGFSVRNCYIQLQTIIAIIKFFVGHQADVLNLLSWWDLVAQCSIHGSCIINFRNKKYWSSEIWSFCFFIIVFWTIFKSFFTFSMWIVFYIDSRLTLSRPVITLSHWWLVTYLIGWILTSPWQLQWLLN